MTPFGARVRELRRERGLLLKDMAAHLGVSSAYLSALERGERGKPTWTLLQGVLQYFRIIWDEADEVIDLPRPPTGPPKYSAIRAEITARDDAIRRPVKT